MDIKLGSLSRAGKHPIRLGIALSGAVALATTCLVSASPAAPLGNVVVKVPSHPSVLRNVQISFHPRSQLPQGGYYYAVLVLHDYLRYPGANPTPSCAISSDMERTAYGYPQRGRMVRLTLVPAKSSEGQWCSHGTYLGAVYAVPHKPPCNGHYRCYGKSAESSPVSGVVAFPGPYSYPNGLPKPLDTRTRIAAHFRINF